MGFEGFGVVVLLAFGQQTEHGECTPTGQSDFDERLQHWAGEKGFHTIVPNGSNRIGPFCIPEQGHPFGRQPYKRLPDRRTNRVQKRKRRTVHHLAGPHQVQNLAQHIEHHRQQNDHRTHHHHLEPKFGHVIDGVVDVRKQNPNGAVAHPVRFEEFHNKRDDLSWGPHLSGGGFKEHFGFHIADQQHQQLSLVGFFQGFLFVLVTFFRWNTVDHIVDVAHKRVRLDCVGAWVAFTRSEGFGLCFVFVGFCVDGIRVHLHTQAGARGIGGAAGEDFQWGGLLSQRCILGVSAVVEHCRVLLSEVLQKAQFLFQQVDRVFRSVPHPLLVFPFLEPIVCGRLFGHPPPFPKIINRRQGRRQLRQVIRQILLKACIGNGGEQFVQPSVTVEVLDLFESGFSFEVLGRYVFAGTTTGG